LLFGHVCPSFAEVGLDADETSTVRDLFAGSWGQTLEGQMTRLRQIALAGLAAVAISGAASSASAVETGTFENRLGGATIGLPLGASPPPGLYTGLETAYLGMLSSPSTSANHGQSAGTWCIPSAGGGCAALPALAQAVPLLWVPGWNVVGATYSFSVVQAFYEFHTCGNAGDIGGSCLGSGPFSSGGFVYTNTFVNPLYLSWNLGGGWFVASGFSFTPPDGTHLAGTPNPDFWTFEVPLAISYLGNNWVASANFFYDVNTRSEGVCCSQSATITNGNLFLGDFTVLYKFGKWSIGPVGGFEWQTTADTGAGCNPAPGVVVCGKRQNIGVGGLIGYDFGPVDLQVWVTDIVEGQNTPQTAGGVNVWTRIGFKIWGFEQPHPLVTKN
jgi:hypothetical protein